VKQANAFGKMVGAARPLQTVLEINRQPDVWRATLMKLSAEREATASFLASPGADGKCLSVILAGAGSSEYVGKSIEAALRQRLNREVATVPTTHFVTHCDTVFLPNREYVLVSFARSGNSPESIATFRRVGEQFQRVKHIVITCNRDGELARSAARSPNVHCILLPEEANDASLAMTSSFSSLVLAGLSLGFLSSASAFSALVGKAISGARRIIGEYGDALMSFAELKFSRACFLGSNALCGCMQEASLKLQEMTAGRVVATHASYLGLRHGPQVFVNDACVVVAALSSNTAVRRYELDLLRELKQKKQGMGTLVICGRSDGEVEELASAVIELFPSEEPLEDEYRVLTDIVACQILAAFKSISLGLSPDNPSPEGIIHRVVEGVVIYPWTSIRSSPESRT
jgi:tagatose-6-phosphate ketose/aldose isomerase